MTFTQAEFNIRLEWGEHGVNLLTPNSDVIIIVDVLSFTTCVEIATNRKAIFYPFRGRQETAQEFARSIGAELAQKRGGARYSLSPKSMLGISEGIKLVLPSPNGSTLTLATGETPTLAGCLRNARAVAEAAKKYGSRIALIPAGERWPDGSLRPSFEDVIGAGAIIHYLNGNCSPEAGAAKSAFLAAVRKLIDHLLQCGSGKELIERGYKDDVYLASELNVSSCVPVLQDGAYVAQ
ncbi:MAG: 2-phosphosulfolactate phosphatase [Anaerolineales bacterium]|nr:2-phosphosulfolactate phosphatase [Anaerolineales bacterium]